MTALIDLFDVTPILLAVLGGLLCERVGVFNIALEDLMLTGATVFLLCTLFDVKGAFRDPNLQGLSGIRIPGIEHIPVLGAILSGHSWIIYCSWWLVPLTQLLLFHHPLGLRMRGVGGPQAQWL